MSTHDLTERSGRETRLLVLVVVVSVVVLVVLARFRFPSANLTVAPPVQGTLAGLVGRTTFEDLGSTLNTLFGHVTPRVLYVRVKTAPPLVVAGRASARGPVSSTPVTMPAIALRLRSNVALTLVTIAAGAAETNSAMPLDVLATDATRDLALIRVPDATIAVDASPTTFSGFGYVGAVTATPFGLTIAPAYVGRADRVIDPLWRGAVFVIDGAADLRPGAFAFTMDGHLIGLVAPGSAGLAIVPGETLLGVADELLRAGTPAS